MAIECEMEGTIPKIIHYCWFSDDPFPKQIKECMATWRDQLRDYEFVHWDREKLYATGCAWAIEAYESKKYAFAADYIRCYSVYHYGGIYLDTDVEVFKPFDQLLCHKSFMGMDSRGDLEAAVFGAQKHSNWLKRALDFYEKRHFVNPDGTFNLITMPQVFFTALSFNSPDEITTILKPTTFPEIVIYPKEYFSPKDYASDSIRITPNTYCVHHFAAGWISRNSWAWRKHQIKLIFVKTFRKFGGANG